MIENIKNLIDNKKVLILGYGREGKSTYNLLKKIGTYQELAIADQKEITDIVEKVIFGDDYLECLDNYDIVIKSPGVALPQDVSAYKCRITSQIELFVTEYREKIIGITGTKGKSTTSSLLYHILKKNNIKTLFAGNIGKPVFDIIDEIEEDTTIVIELSVHQLEYLKVSPHQALFLNIYEDHLERYNTLENYRNIKENIYRYQKADDFLYCLEEYKPTNISSNIKVINNKLPFADFKEIGFKGLQGKHNLVNISFVYEVARKYNISDESFIKALITYVGLPHRLEYIGTKSKVDYYDDSISTTVESTINAMESIENAKIILLGGMDRGIDYTKLITYLKTKDLDYIITMYDSGKRIYQLLEEAKVPNIKYIETLEKTVSFVLENAKENTACILSPASASYGYFKDFEERGDKYKMYIFDKR